MSITTRSFQHFHNLNLYVLIFGCLNQHSNFYKIMFEQHTMAKKCTDQFYTQTIGTVFPEIWRISLVCIHGSSFREKTGTDAIAKLSRFPVSLSQHLPCKRTELSCAEGQTGGWCVFSFRENPNISWLLFMFPTCKGPIGTQLSKQQLSHPPSFSKGCPYHISHTYCLQFNGLKFSPSHDRNSAQLIL